MVGYCGKSRSSSQSGDSVDFTIRADGVVRLNPELARRVAQIVVQ